MGWIIGIFVSFVTFPGAIMQTFAMKLMCDVLKVDVYEVAYPSGTIMHGQLRSTHTAFAIATAPFLLNTLLCSVLTFPFVFAAIHGSAAMAQWPAIISGYLGVCMGMHAFPDADRMKEFMALAEQPASGPVRFLYSAIRWIFWLARILRVLWFDAIYTLAVSCALPLLLG